MLKRTCSFAKKRLKQHAKRIAMSLRRPAPDPLESGPSSAHVAFDWFGCQAALLASLRPRAFHPLERQDSYALAPVHGTLVRFGLERKRVAIDGVEPDLIGSQAPAIPFDVDVMHDLARRHTICASVCEHRLVKLDPLCVGGLIAWSWLITGHKEHKHPAIR